MSRFVGIATQYESIDLSDLVVFASLYIFVAHHVPTRGTFMYKCQESCFKSHSFQTNMFGLEAGFRMRIQSDPVFDWISMDLVSVPGFRNIS